MIIAKVKMDNLRCDFNLFFVYSKFKSVIDNGKTNGDINESNPYVCYKLTTMAGEIICE